MDRAGENPMLANMGTVASTAEVRPAVGLRILAFCDYFRPHTEGGSERVAREVYTRLAEWGAKLTVVTTTSSSGSWREGIPGVRVVEVPGLDLTRHIGVQMTLTRGAFRRALQLRGELRPHVLHANSLEFQTSLAAARLQRHSHIPMVLTAHIAGFDSMSQPWRTLGQIYERTMSRYLLRRSTRVIAVSEGVARYLGRFSGLEKRISVVPNGVDHDVFRPRESSGGNVVSLLYIGRLIGNKGPGLAVEAAALLRGEGLPIRLTVVGEGPMRRLLEQRVRELGIEDVVGFTGRSDEVPRHLQDADVLLRPTQTEGMPLTVLEAMACRVCVVASNVPGNASLIEHGETGLLYPPGDFEALVRSLRSVIADADQRRRLAEAGHAISRQYSWDRSARETLAVLVDAIRDEPKGRVP